MERHTRQHFSQVRQCVWVILYLKVLNLSRIIFISVLYCGSLIHWHWKASIISHLSVVVPNIPFHDLGELQTSPYQVTLLKNSAYQEVFEEAQTGQFKAIWETKFKNKEKSLKSEHSEMVSVISRGEYAMYEGYSVVKALDGWNDCSITDANFVVNYLDNAFAFPKNSPFKDLFDQTLQKMIESGELQRIQRVYASKKPDCGGSKGRSLGFGTTCSALLVISIGIVACIVFLLLEIIVWKIV